MNIYPKSHFILPYAGEFLSLFGSDLTNPRRCIAYLRRFFADPIQNVLAWFFKV